MNRDHSQLKVRFRHTAWPDDEAGRAVHPPGEEAAIFAQADELNAPSLGSSNTTARLVGMGIDWENILGASGNGLDDAYDSAVSEAIYSDDPGEDRLPLPVGEEHDDTDGLR